MKDEGDTREHLLDELKLLRQRLARLERSEAKREQVQQELHKINRALRAHSRCSESLMRSTSEESLLKDICRIIVKMGGYRLAWVGFAEHDADKTVRPAAQMGFEDGYLDTVEITWADTDRGRGPTGTAIRTGEPTIVRNIQTDPHYGPWRSEAGKRGFASSIALPLIANGQTLGSLNIYAAEPDAFDKEEVELLSRLADDLAYGILALRTKAELKSTEQELRKHRDHLEELVAERTTELREATEKLKRDLAERKRLERALVQRNKLNTLGAIAAEVAHEIRNPLVSIGGFTRRLQKKFPEVAEYDIILKECKRLEEILHRIRDYLKPVQIRPEECSVNAIVSGCVDLMSPETKRKMVTCQLDLGSEMANAYVDRDILAQIFINLILNAVGATEKGGTLFIRSFETDEDIQIEFKNLATGPMVKNPDLLFMPFSEGGESIGLPLCYRLLKDMGGLLSFALENGYTVFTVSLPKVTQLFPKKL
jgi:signal transduction histidine kinase